MKWVSGLFLALVLCLIVQAYLQPAFIVDAANLVRACF